MFDPLAGTGVPRRLPMINGIKCTSCWYQCLAMLDNQMSIDSVLFEVVGRRRHCLLCLDDGLGDNRVCGVSDGF